MNFRSLSVYKLCYSNTILTRLKSKMWLKLPRLEALGWLSCYIILGSFLSSLPMAHGEDTLGLKLHYQRLYKFYHENQADIKSDCKVRGGDNNPKDPHHAHWGTTETLQFLSGNLTDGATLAEKRTNLTKLRQYLARVGYLKDPGSLVFMDRQMLTLHLTDCKASSVWRQQGEKDTDAKFQEDYYTGKNLKNQAPNAANYIHKYTCFNTGDHKCTHTFYVITKMLPELPLGLLVREYTKSEEYDFACTLPVCSLKNCNPHGTVAPFPRKSYPPFQIYWGVPEKLAKVLSKTEGDLVITKAYYKKASTTATKQEFEFVWDDKLRKDKKLDLTLKNSYEDPESYDWKNGFGEIKKPAADNDLYALQSRIQILRGNEDNQHGLYECVIEDDNGVVTTPNVLSDEYRGDAVIHVIHDELLFGYVVAVASLLITFLIIWLCPKKLEKEDGTPYTKAELSDLDESKSTNNDVKSTIVHTDIVHTTRDRTKSSTPKSDNNMNPINKPLVNTSKDDIQPPPPLPTRATKHVVKKNNASFQEDEIFLLPPSREKVHVQHVKPKAVVAEVEKHQRRSGAEPHTKRRTGSEEKSHSDDGRIDSTENFSSVQSGKSKSKKKKRRRSTPIEKPLWKEHGHASIARSQPHT